MKKLQEEVGVTEISTENINLLVTLHGPVRFLIHHAPDGDTMRDMTFFKFQDGFSHTATGFSSGYAGEGPRGLLNTIQKHLNRDDITMEHVAMWRGSDYMVLSGPGKGEEIHNFLFNPKGTRTEIW